MAALSDEDCLAIKQNPLEPTIGHLRKSLGIVVEQDVDSQKTKAISEGDTESDSTEAEVDTEDQPDVKGALLDLLSALAGHHIAKRLWSKEFQGTVFGKLGTLFDRLLSDELSTAVFEPLVQTIVQEKPDVEIWKQVLLVITSASRITPPPSVVRTSFGGTPRTHTSASHQGSEQTKDLLYDALRRELKDNSYIEVEGFFEKYFNDKSWTPKAKQIYERVKTQWANGRWTTFPDPPTETAVWSWLSKFQDEHLPDSRSMYYRTWSQEEMAGLDSKGQLDIFLTRRGAGSNDSHKWSQVLVVGEHTVSKKDSKKFWQLTRYMRSIFSLQPRRQLVHGFILFHTKMELHVFDRSGAFSAKQFDIHDEPDRFIRTIVGYSMMTDEELGLDTFIERKRRSEFITVNEEGSNKRQRLQLKPSPIAHQAAIIGRGTSCYQATKPKAVVKFSWVDCSRSPTEPELLTLANENQVQGVPRLIGHCRFGTTGELREGLAFTKKKHIPVGTSRWKSQHSSTSFSSQSRSTQLSEKPKEAPKRKSIDEEPSHDPKRSRSNSQASRLVQVQRVNDSFDDLQSSSTSSPTNKPFVDRVLSCQVTTPAGRPLREFTSVPQVLRALRDAIKVHKSLFMKGPILHRDVSNSNILIADPTENDGLSGMLIDVELGTIIKDGKNTRTESKRMTGTLKYMAIEVVECQEDVEHTYRHDLESFFYVFLDMCVNHGWKHGEKPKSDPLKDWYVPTSYDSIITAKTGHMVPRRFASYILASFSPQFESVKDLATTLRELLFLKADLRIGTPTGDANVLYDQMVAAFDKAIENMEN